MFLPERPEKYAGSASKTTQAVKNLIFIAGLVLLCHFTAQTFERKESISRYRPFLEQKEDFDVLLVGTSHVCYGCYPMELWNEYGIVSYNFGNSNTEIASSYWNVMNALDHTRPKLIVFDVARLGKEQRVRDAETMHESIDIFPLSLTKIRTVQDLIQPRTRDGDANPLYDRRLEMLWDFVLYHSRWSELTKGDFIYDANAEKGAISVYNVAVPAEFEVVPRKKYTEKNTTGVQYLRKMIEECQSRDLDILLTYFPVTITKTRQKTINYTYLIAEEYGVDFINFNHVEGLLDPETDFNDSSNINCHLNTSGAKKLTAYLGQYIRENYDVPDRRGDAAYAHWFADYDVYVDKKETAFAQERGLERYLAQIADKNYNVCVRVRAGSGIFDQSRLIKLLKNLSPYQEPVGLEAAREAAADYWMYIDHNENTVREEFGDSVPEWLEAWPIDEEAETEVQIVVIHKKTGEVTDVSEWYRAKDGLFTRSETGEASPADEGFVETKESEI